MDIQATKLELLKLLLNTKKESTLKKIEAILKEDAVDWWQDLCEDEKHEIEEGLKQAELGEITEHKEVMNHFDRWK